MREEAARVRLVPAWVWFSLVGLAVAGPLLGPGYLLLLDFPSGPRFPEVPVLPLPSTGDVGSATPLLALHALLRGIHPFLADKLFLLAPVVVGGLGLYRLTRTRLAVGALPAVYGATLFVVNPFVEDRYLAGHLHFLLALSLLPWALAAIHDVIRAPSPRSAVPMGLWFFGLSVVDLHVAGFYALLVALAAVVAPARRLAVGGTALGLGALLSSYWVIPSLFVAPGSGIGPADLAVYASRPEGASVVPTLVGLHGFWRDEFVSAAQRFPLLHLLLVPILGLAVAGTVHLLSGGAHRRLAAVLAVAAVLGLVLAAGTSFGPTAGAFRWLFDHVPPFRIYREPQKFLALLVLAYAVFGAAGLHALAAGGRALTRVGSVLAVLAVLGYGGGMLWGLSGRVEPAQYPGSWAEAERAMEALGPGRLLVLPWHLYAVWGFSDGRIVANPAPSFFSREVLAGDEAALPGAPPQSPDPFSRYVRGLLTERQEVRSFGHLVAPLGVRFVAWMREADWWQYRFLDRQTDLDPIYRGDGIVLYENQAWAGEVVGLSAGDQESGGLNPAGSDEGPEATRRLYTDTPLVAPADDAFPSVARPLPLWERIEAPTGASFVATADRCTDGWRLGDEPARCHLGAVAAFPAPGSSEPLWRPLAGARILGFVLSCLTLAGASVYLWRTSRRRTR